MNQAAREHGVPASTLNDRVSGCVVDGTNPPYLNSTDENELVSYLVESANLRYGKTRRQVKGIVEKVAVERGTLRLSCVIDGW